MECKESSSEEFVTPINKFRRLLLPNQSRQRDAKLGNEG